MSSAAEGRDPDGTKRAVGLRWLVRLRYGAIAIELCAIGVASLALGVALPLAALLGLVALTALPNLWLHRRVARGGDAAVAFVLLFDISVLTALLHASGGASNPFSVAYLVYVTLAAVLLSPRATTGVLVGAALGYGLLFLLAPDDPHAHHRHMMSGDGGFEAHLYGMYVALVLAAGLIAYFVSRLSAAMRQRELELSSARARVAQAERLAALTAVCAGAAHELGSPLGTIALAAAELPRALDAADAADGRARVLDDAQLIRAEVARCRSILDRMAARFGDAVGEAPQSVEAPELFAALEALLPGRERVRFEVREGAPAAQLPLGSVAQALANVVDNALDASSGPVEVTAQGVDGALVIEVRDEGPGMEPSVLERASEPFFTTKAEGRGMGLGLYLARVSVERLGGRLELRSKVDSGTRVRFLLPSPGGNSR